MKKYYALIDGDITTGIFAMLKTFNPPHLCLYNPPVRPDLVDAAPYLVELTGPIKTWLDQHKAAWGIYIATKAPLIELRKHLRKYSYALIPESEAPIFFRFYDPRVIWDITSIMDDHALHAFMGPIDTIATNYEGIYRQERFTERRAPFPTPHRMKSNYITLNEKQYAAFNRFSEVRYIEELARHMMRFVDPKLIEKVQNSAEKIHQRMLEHERDVKGATITHPVDQAFLLNQSAKAEERSEQKGQNEQKGIRLEALIAQTAQPQESSDPSNLQQAHYHFSRKTGEWRLVRGNHQEPVIFVISRALSQIGKTPMNQNLFHEQTNFEYIAAERAEYERKDQAQKEVAVPNHLKNYHEHPYFLKQGNDWYFVDKEGYANLVEDNRVSALNELYQNERITKILEGYFHGRTNNRYKEQPASKVTPFVQETPKEDEPYMPETMDELRDAINQLACDLYAFCDTQNITYNRPIKGLGQLYITRNIFRFKDTPQNWLDRLLINEDAGFYRAEELLDDELGYIP